MLHPRQSARCLVCVASMALTVLPAGPSLAQDGAPRLDAPVRLGPVLVTPALRLTRLGVDSNVFNAPGEPEADFTVSGGPKIDVTVPLRKFVFTADTATDFVYYNQFANQRGVNFDMTLRGELDLHRLGLFLEESFLDTRQRPNFEIDVRARRQENDVATGLSLQFSPRVDVEVARRQASRRYAGNDLVGARLADTLDRDAVDTRGTLRYAVTPLTLVTVDAGTREETYPLSPDRNHSSWSIVPGVSFSPRAIVSGTARVGYRSIQGRHDVLPDFRGPVSSVDLTYRVLGTTTIGFTAERGVEFSLEPLEPYFVAEALGGSLRQQLTTRYAVSMSVDRIDYAYRRFVGVEAAGEPTGRIDTIRRYTVGLHRRISRTTEVGFDVSRHQRRSNAVEHRSYDGLLAGLTMTYAF